MQAISLAPFYRYLIFDQIGHLYEQWCIFASDKKLSKISQKLVKNYTFPTLFTIISWLTKCECPLYGILLRSSLVTIAKNYPFQTLFTDISYLTKCECSLFEHPCAWQNLSKNCRTHFFRHFLQLFHTLLFILAPFEKKMKNSQKLPFTDTFYSYFIADQMWVPSLWVLTHPCVWQKKSTLFSMRY